MGFYESPRWSNEIADCSMPMTFDTYSNCAFSCIYCFSMYQRAIGGKASAYLNKQVKHVNTEKVKAIFKLERPSQFENYIKSRKVFQWGGLSDQFDGFERKYGKTLELLKFFKEIDYPISFSTKSTWWLKDKRYTDLFKGQKNWNVKFSIITLDEYKAKEIERGVPSPKERLEAIKRFTDLDAGGATLRLRPFIIGVSSPTYLELITKAAEAGATALSTEFFCLETRSRVLRQYLPVLNKLAGYDIFKFYKKYSSCRSGYLRLNRNIKRPFMVKMQELAHSLGMRFYVSDAHFKEMSDGANCCGLPTHWNYSRGHWSQALQIAKQNKDNIVKFSDVSDEIYLLHNNYLFTKAEGYNCNSSEKRAKFCGMTMAEYLKWLWNNPQNGQSPYKLFEGVLKPIGKDEQGNLIYKLDKTRL